VTARAAPTGVAGPPARPGPARRLGHAEVYAAIAALSFLAARFLPVLETGYRCPVKAGLGIPCLTCGFTRAFVHLAHGEPVLALQASPAGALLAALAWAFALAAAARLALGRAWPAPPPRLVRPAILAAGVALVLSWLYVLGSTLGSS
jgi:hypothetical protein